MTKTIGALAVALVLAAPTMAFAAQGHHGHRAATQSRAQAPESSDSRSVGHAEMSPQREQALRDCARAEQKMGSQSTWGVQQLSVYRACMTAHGQAE